MVGRLPLCCRDWDTINSPDKWQIPAAQGNREGEEEHPNHCSAVRGRHRGNQYVTWESRPIFADYGRVAAARADWAVFPEAFSSRSWLLTNYRRNANRLALVVVFGLRGRYDCTSLCSLAL